MFRFPEPDYWPRTYVEVGCSAFLISVVLMPLGILLMRRFNLVDAVEENKIHRHPVPRGAGVVIWIAFAAAVLIPEYRSKAMNGILIGSFVCLLVGAADDFVGRIPGIYKLFTLFAVTLVLSHYGVRTNIFGNVYLDTALTMIWIAGVTSAFNGADNMDGLAGGVAVIVSLLFFLIALQTHLHAGTETSLSWFGMLAIGLAGACLGFLVYNIRPAVIFMGDSGSFFLGFTLAALSVMGEWTSSRLLSAIIPIVILGVPLSDFAYVIGMRILRGETRTLRSIIDHCAPDHLSHRLVWIGFSQRKAVFFIYLFCFALGTTGVLLRNSGSAFDGGLALVQAVTILAIIVGLMATIERRHQAIVRDEVERANIEAAHNRRHGDTS